MKSLLLEYIRKILMEGGKKFSSFHLGDDGKWRRVNFDSIEAKKARAKAEPTRYRDVPPIGATIEKGKEKKSDSSSASSTDQSKTNQIKQSSTTSQDTPVTRNPRHSVVPDLGTTLNRVGEDVAKSVQSILSKSLGPKNKNQNLGGDSDQKRRVLSGELKVRGQGATATGPVHEVTIGLALDIIMKHPDISDEDISRLIENEIKTTELGASLGKRLYTTTSKAVRSARAEAVRLTLGIRKNEMNPETTISDHYHGNEESKDKLITDMKILVGSGYSVFTSAGIEIDPKDIPDLIKNAGSSAHGNLITPGDTFVVSVDPETKKVILGTSSNKTERGDQSFNTTLLKELEDYRSSLQSLVQSDHLNGADLEAVEIELKQTDTTIKELSSQISSVFVDPVTKLGDPKNPKIRKEFISYVTEKSASSGRRNLPKYFKRFTHPYKTFDITKTKLTKKEKKIKSNLEEVGWKSGDRITPEIATAAWVFDMKSRLEGGNEKTGITVDEAKLIDRFFQTKTDGKIDTTTIRMAAINALRTRHNALSKIKCTIDGKVLPVSQVVLGIFTARALHLEESLKGIPGASKVYTEYPCFFKAVTGDIVGYPEANQAALGTDRFVDFCMSLEISEPKIAKKRGSKDDAGTITFDIISVTGAGEKRPICVRVVRTKGGMMLHIVVVPLRGYTDIVAANQPKI